MFWSFGVSFRYIVLNSTRATAELYGRQCSVHQTDHWLLVPDSFRGLQLLKMGKDPSLLFIVVFSRENLSSRVCLAQILLSASKL